jgi:hypothetical protein
MRVVENRLMSRTGSTSNDPDAGLSLPAWTYSDPEFFAVEMERVIRTSWQIVCHESDVANAGDWHTLDYAGESVVVVRGHDSKLRAVANVCRHRGSRLLDGASGCARLTSISTRRNTGSRPSTSKCFRASSSCG